MAARQHEFPGIDQTGDFVKVRAAQSLACSRRSVVDGLPWRNVKLLQGRSLSSRVRTGVQTRSVRLCAGAAMMVQLVAPSPGWTHG
jgi:hypothetical protein